jgi:hypothetical protein
VVDGTTTAEQGILSSITEIFCGSSAKMTVLQKFFIAELALVQDDHGPRASSHQENS